MVVRMSDSLLIRAFWGPRQESVNQIAERMVKFGTGLDTLIGRATSWKVPGGDEVTLSELGGVQQVLQGAMQKSLDAPHLGLLQSFRSNSPKVGKLSLTVVAGGYSNSDNVYNSVVLKCPETDASRSIALEALSALASAWDPDWGEVTSYGLIDAMENINFPERSPGIGHMTYLSGGRTELLPEVDANIANCENGSILTSVNDDGLLSVDDVLELAQSLDGSVVLSGVPTNRSKF